MKIKFLAIIGLVLFRFSLFGQSNDRLPTFILDDKHSQAQPKDSKIKPEKYKLTSPLGFNLICAGYDFSTIRSLNNGKNPDAIFIVCKAGNFMAPLNIAGQTTIDKSTMQSIDKKNKIFTGFEKGDTPIIALGTVKINGDKADMKSFWVGMLEVL
jgi:hypothetical protein